MPAAVPPMSSRSSLSSFSATECAGASQSATVPASPSANAVSTTTGTVRLRPAPHHPRALTRYPSTSTNTGNVSGNISGNIGKRPGKNGKSGNATYLLSSPNSSALGRRRPPTGKHSGNISGNIGKHSGKVFGKVFGNKIGNASGNCGNPSTALQDCEIM